MRNNCKNVISRRRRVINTPRITSYNVCYTKLLRLGFLVLNWHPARIFMGDVGSTAIGLLLCAAFFDPTARPVFDWPLLAAGLPFFGDAAYTLCRRAIRRENIFDAHHSHVYQRLMRSGLGHDAVALRYIGLTILCGA